MRVPGRWRSDLMDSRSERDRTEMGFAQECWKEAWQSLPLAFGK